MPTSASQLRDHRSPFVPRMFTTVRLHVAPHSAHTDGIEALVAQRDTPRRIEPIEAQRKACASD